MNRINAPVFVCPCPDYSQASCDAAMETILSNAPALQNIAPGTKVAVKANLVTLLKPEKAATTHPALLKALTDWLKARGALVTIGDAPGGTYTKAYLDNVYTATGMRQTGACLNQDFSVKHAEYPGAAVLKDFDYTGWLDEADLIINFCKLKTHGMMGLSCAVKNMFGTIPGLTKPTYHYRFPDYENFADMLVDLNEYFHPALQIVDAVVAMEGNGPTMGKPRQVGAVLASESPYSLDLVCAHLIGLKVSQVPTLTAAGKRGLVPTGWEDVTVVGELAPLLVSDFDTASADCPIENFLGNGTVFGRKASHAAKRLLEIKPQLQKALCVGCGKCAGLCPAGAIVLQNKAPVINRRKCIRCFCCQEFCPVGALKAKRSRLGELALKLTQK